MRKTKAIVLQDHILHILEIDSADEKFSCRENLQLQDDLASFLIEGSINQYTKSSAEDPWVLVQAPGPGPEWEFAKTNTIVGSMATSAGKNLVFIPIDSSTAPKPTYVAETNLNEIDRDSFVELGTQVGHNKMNANTFAKISVEDEVTDEVIFE